MSIELIFISIEVAHTVIRGEHLSETTNNLWVCAMQYACDMDRLGQSAQMS